MAQVRFFMVKCLFNSNIPISTFISLRVIYCDFMCNKSWTYNGEVARHQNDIQLLVDTG